MPGVHQRLMYYKGIIISPHLLCIAWGLDYKEGPEKQSLGEVPWHSKHQEAGVSSRE